MLLILGPGLLSTCYNQGEPTETSWLLEAGADTLEYYCTTAPLPDFLHREPIPPAEPVVGPSPPAPGGSATALRSSEPPSIRRSREAIPQPILLAAPNDRSRTFRPGEIVTFCVIASHQPGAAFPVVEELQHPPGWSPMFSPEVYTLEPAADQHRLLAVAIPANTLAGEYSLTYRAWPQDRKSLARKVHIPVTVGQEQALALAVVEAPGAVIAGEAYRVGVDLMNRGNVALEVETSVFSSDRFAFDEPPSSWSIAPGGSETLWITVQARDDLTRSIRHHVRVTARIRNADQNREFVENILTEVLPPVGTGPDPFVRLPLRLTVGGVTEEGRSSWQGELVGSGPLDERGRRRLELLLRAPGNRNESAFFGKREEYRARYTSPQFTLDVGDHYFGLSRLSNNFSYGRGATLRFQPERHTKLGLHWSSDPVDSRRRRWGAYLRGQLGGRLWAKAGFLEQTNGLTSNEDGRIYSLESGLALSRHEIVQVEVALHDQEETGPTGDDQAYRVVLRSERDRRRVILERIRAGKGFGGYYQDYEQTSGLLQWQHSRHLRSHFSFQRSGDLERDRGDQGLDQGGFTYRPVDSPRSYSLEGRHAFLKPGAGSSEPGYDETSLRANASLMRGRQSLNAFLELGRQRGYGRSDTKSITRFSLLANLALSRRASVYLQGQLSDRDDLGGGLLGSGSYLSASVNWRPRKRVRLSVRTSANNLSSRVRRETFQLDSTLKAGLSDRLDLEIRARYYDSEFEKGRSGVRVALTRGLGVPVRRRSSVGGVEGRVFSADIQGAPPLPGVIVRLNDLATLTSANGSFFFPAVKPGAYRLSIDQSSLGLNRAPRSRLPVTLNVQGGKTSRVEIEIVRVASLRGKVTVFASGAVLDTEDTVDTDPATAASEIYLEGTASQTISLHSGAERVLRPSHGLANILVELSDGTAVLRRYSNAAGDFDFTDLTPGHWTLKVYEAGLPPYHVLEQQQMNFLLKPEDTVEVELRVIPRLRTIRILENVDLSSASRGGDKKGD